MVLTLKANMFFVIMHWIVILSNRFFFILKNPFFFYQIMIDKKGKSWKSFQHYYICNNFYFLHILKFGQETSFKTGYFSFGFCSICVHILYTFFSVVSIIGPFLRKIFWGHIFIFPLIYNISMHKHLYKTASKSDEKWGRETLSKLRKV